MIPAAVIQQAMEAEYGSDALLDLVESLCDQVDRGELAGEAVVRARRGDLAGSVGGSRRFCSTSWITARSSPRLSPTGWGSLLAQSPR